MTDIGDLLRSCRPAPLGPHLVFRRGVRHLTIPFAPEAARTQPGSFLRFLGNLLCNVGLRKLRHVVSTRTNRSAALALSATASSHVCSFGALASANAAIALRTSAVALLALPARLPARASPGLN